MKQKIEFNRKGQIIEGEYSPNGEIMVEDDTKETGGYYIYIWPKNGTTWTDSKNEMIYDVWLENENKIIPYFKARNWIIKWK